jgi:CRISPR/Cas system CSM-associated protein Csm3 (group 7 of RAMP superfamily)
MHFYRTRPYVPGKPLWGALTAKLTPLLGLDDYQKVGEFLKKVIRPGYLYPYIESNEKSELYYPKYTEKGLMFGLLSKYEFEKRFISSMASTAIEAQSLTAEDGMLHEVEFISHYTIDDGKPVFMSGFIWVREFSENDISLSIKDEVIITCLEKKVKFKDQLANRLQLGGERKYGFGLVELHKIVEIKDPKFNELPGEWKEENGEVCISLKRDDPIWAHVKHFENLKIKGDIELLVGREWDPDKGAGQKPPKSSDLCWTPGSILCEDRTFKVDEFGIWRKI